MTNLSAVLTFKVFNHSFSSSPPPPIFAYTSNILNRIPLYLFRFKRFFVCHVVFEQRKISPIDSDDSPAEITTIDVIVQRQLLIFTLVIEDGCSKKKKDGYWRWYFDYLMSLEHLMCISEFTQFFLKKNIKINNMSPAESLHWTRIITIARAPRHVEVRDWSD